MLSVYNCLDIIEENGKINATTKTLTERYPGGLRWQVKPKKFNRTKN